MECKIVNNDVYYGERLIGRFNKNILFVNRKRDKHLHIKLNAYGLNKEIIDKFKDRISFVHLTDEFGTYRLNIEAATSYESYTFGNFEEQYFIPLYVWEDNRVNNWDERDLNRIEMMGESWYVKLKDEFDKQYLITLSLILKERREVSQVYPEKHEMFKAFKLTHYDDVKVVIIGQDPYHDGSATGLAFANRKQPVNIPQVLSPSLKQIESALELEYGFHLSPIDPTLEYWASQGVLLLNPILTVERGRPLHHEKLGWQRFTGEAIRKLNNDKTGIVFMAWGSKAQAFIRDNVNPSRHLIIECEHPAYGLYQKTKRIWLNKLCFSKCNRYLISHDKEPIKWLENLPKPTSELLESIEKSNAIKANQETLDL